MGNYPDKVGGLDVAASNPPVFQIGLPDLIVKNHYPDKSVAGMEKVVNVPLGQSARGNAANSQ
jgi:hypothetical protein